MEPNPKSLCALEARIEALQIRLAQNEEQLVRALLTFQRFVETHTEISRPVHTAPEDYSAPNPYNYPLDYE